MTNRYKQLKTKNDKKFRIKREYDKRSHIYDAKWRSYTFKFLSENKTCYSCGGESQVVDHFIAHKRDEILFKALHNHVPLCKKCHNFVTGKFDCKKPPDTQGKLDWLKTMRLINNVNVKIKVMVSYD